MQQQTAARGQQHPLSGNSANNHQAHLSNAYQELGRELSSERLKVVGGYTIGRVIGEGTFGSVHLATHRLTGTRCAIKKVPKTMSGMLTRELHHHRRLHHPHIVQLYEIIATESHIWLVAELCSGGELFDYLVERGRLPEIEARRIFGELAVAVGHMHKNGVVHRDLKLENVLLDGELRVKLGDLGFAREWQRGRMMETFCGTTGYASPEMLEGRKYLGVETDVWSLGVILYTLLCGGLPFDDDDERVMRDLIIKGEIEEPEWLSIEARNLIHGLLAHDPANRLPIEQILIHPWFKMRLAEEHPSAPATPNARAKDDAGAVLSSAGKSPSLHGPQLVRSEISPLTLDPTVAPNTFRLDSPTAVTAESPIRKNHSGEFSQTEQNLEQLHSARRADTKKGVKPHLPGLQEDGETQHFDDDPLHLPPASHSRIPSRTKRRSVSSTLSLERRHSHHSASFAPDYLQQLNQPLQAPFKTSSEQHLLHKISDLGMDTNQIVHSVETNACDNSAAIWWILRVKQAERGETDEAVEAKAAADAKRKEQAAAFAREERRKAREAGRDPSPSLRPPIVTFAEAQQQQNTANLDAEETSSTTDNKDLLSGSPRAGKSRSPSLSMLQRATSVLGPKKGEDERSTSPSKLVKPLPMPRLSVGGTASPQSARSPEASPSRPSPAPASGRHVGSMTARSSTTAPSSSITTIVDTAKAKQKRDSFWNGWNSFRYMFNDDKRKRKQSLDSRTVPTVVLSRGIAARAPHVNRMVAASTVSRRSSIDRPPYSRRSSSLNSRRSSINSAHLAAELENLPGLARRTSLQSHGSQTPTSEREPDHPFRPESANSRRRASALRSPSLQSESSGRFRTPASPLHDYHRRPPSGSASTRVRHLKVIPEPHAMRSSSMASSTRSNASSRASSQERGSDSGHEDGRSRRRSVRSPLAQPHKTKAPLRDVFQPKDDEWEDEDDSGPAGGLGQMGSRLQWVNGTRAAQHPSAAAKRMGRRRRAVEDTKETQVEVPLVVDRRILSSGRPAPVAEEEEEEESTDQPNRLMPTPS